MDVVVVAFGAIVGLLGLVGLITSLLHASPGQTKIIRLLAWPGITPSDRVALLLSSTLLLIGAILFLLGSHAAPNWLIAVVSVAGFLSAVMLGLRRTEA